MADSEINEVYPYILDEKVKSQYKNCHPVLHWLINNLESLKDDNNETIFNKVNIGYSEDKLKAFTKKPVVDIHMNTVEFINDFDESKPNIINTILVFKLKGNNNRVNDTASIILDYLIQEFSTNKDFRTFENIVSDTRISSAGIRHQPNNQSWYVLGVLELAHQLF